MARKKRTRADVLERMLEKFDEHLFALLLKGRVAFGADGAPIINADDGKLMRRDASAADLAVIARWLTDPNNHDLLKRRQERGGIGDIAKALRLVGGQSAAAAG